MATTSPGKQPLFMILALDGVVFALVLGYALTQGLSQQDLYWLVPLLAVVGMLQVSILRRLGGRPPDRR